MGKRRRILPAALFLAVLGGLAWVTLRPPVYHGKTLTAWLDQYGSSHWSGNHELNQQAEAAIRHFGTNFIPVYLKMISTHPSSFKTNLLSRIPQAWLTRLHIPSVNDYEYKPELNRSRTRGAFGLIALGPDAKPAVPSLIVLTDDRRFLVRCASVLAIRGLGPVAHEARPAIIKCLNDPVSGVREEAVAALGAMHEQPELVIPLLLEYMEKHRDSQIGMRTLGNSCYDDPARAIPALVDFLEKKRGDPTSRFIAVSYLGGFQDRSAAAEPVLLELLSDPDAAVRYATINALGSICAQPGLVVPALATNLVREEGNPGNLFAAFHILAQYGPDARSAVPALLQFTDYPNPDIRKSATDALKAIDPEAAAKAGVK